MKNRSGCSEFSKLHLPSPASIRILLHYHAKVNVTAINITIMVKDLLLVFLLL
jgi:hypothetical protein